VVTAVQAVGAPRLTRSERFAVTLLGLALPDAFRARQRGEWTGDLMELSSGRARYLLAAAWTLPQLRAAVRRVGGGTPAGGVAAPHPALQTVTRALLSGLGIPVLCWYLMAILPYEALHMADRYNTGGPVDPKDVLPHVTGLEWLTSLSWTLHAVAMLPILGGAWLISFLALAALVTGPFERGRDWRYRTAACAVGVLLFVAAAAAAMSIQLPYEQGLTVGGLGLLALGLAARGRTLRPRRRLLLTVLGLAAVVIAVVHHTAYGADLLNWMLD
jgi:hypothetical protein